MELFEARKKLKITQGDLAKELKVSRATLCNWENGKAMPTIESAKRIKKYFEKYGIEIEIKI